MSNYKVKITDPEHPHFGEKLEMRCVFYDVFYRGGTDKPVIDLYHYKQPNGIWLRIYSNQIDTDDYLAQERAEEAAKHGVKVGDTVMITRAGSGTWGGGFRLDEPHVVTNISGSYVEFDDGKARMFQPDMEVIETEKA